MGCQWHIAVCEDMDAERAHLVRTAHESLEGTAIHLRCTEYASGEALLEGFALHRFDAVFLDIYMGGMTGMDVARRLRALDADLPIVFVTVSPEFALEGYQVRAAHYLIKPVRTTDLGEIWARMRQRQPERTVTLMVDRKPIDVHLRDILYAEADNKRCRLCTASGRIVTRLSIDQLQQLLPDPPFCRCHRGYIVNFDQVQSVEEDFLMKNGDTVYIRKAEYARIREAYFLHLVERAKRGRTEAQWP